MSKKLENALKRIIGILEKLNIEYKITGGFAVNIHGSKRPTADIDIDLNENKMNIVLPYVKDYIIYGLDNYKDEERDIKLITLNYKGQEIDLCGTENTKIFDKNTGKREKLNPNFKTVETIKIFGIDVKVTSAKELIRYKSKLLREVDIEDIKILSKRI